MENYEDKQLEELLNFKHDNKAWYWIGMAYFEYNDFVNAAQWLEKTMNDPNNEWAGKAAQNLGIIHEGYCLPNSSKDEALRLYEKSKHLLVSKLNAGFLYLNGTESGNIDREKGKKYIEEVIERLMTKDENDNYLSQIECYKIGVMYEQETVWSLSQNDYEKTLKYRYKAIEYYQKAIDRCILNDGSENQLIQNANAAIEALRGY